MSLDLQTPLALLLLPLVPILLRLAGRSLQAFHPRQRRWALVTRGLLLGTLLLALAAPRLGRPSDRLAMVIAVDVSSSVRPPQQAEQQTWVRQALQLAQPGDRVRVITFGRWAAVGDPAESQALPSPDATSLADALELAGSLLPDRGQRRIVLLTDGQQNDGRAQEIAQQLAGRGIEISFVRPEPRAALADAALRGLEVPPYIRQGEALQADAVIESNYAGRASLRLLVDGQQVAQQPVQLTGGIQRVSLSVRADHLDYHVLRAELQADGDSIPENNAAESFTVVKPAGQVLLLESRPGEAASLEQVLRESGLQTSTLPASAVPPSAALMPQYDAIVLVNVPATAFSLDQQRTLLSLVQNDGKGLFVAGGNTSFALGGYESSALGEALPVDPKPPPRRERGSVTLILVIDKSGSMDLYRNDVSKIAMAREAAMLAAESLQPDDVVGVLAFDTRQQWVVPPTRLQAPSDLEQVKARIAGLQADGGTNIFPALEAAYQAAAASPTPLKHIVLLTDGQSADGDYAGLIARMKPASITLTTVGIGSDTDTELLTRLALMGDGRFYSTERAQEIPRIVTRETTIVSSSPLVEGVVRPVVSEASAILADLEGQEAPPLSGYVATGARPRAHTILSTEKGDPLLAAWQYGLGRVVAWTSDTQPSWAGRWLELPAARQVWSQAVRWSMPPPIDPRFQVSTAVQHDQATISVEALENDGRFAAGRDLRATVVTPAQQAFQLPLRQVAPGRYEVSARVGEPGAYMVRVDELGGGAPTRSEMAGFVVASAEELRTVNPNRPLLQQLAHVSGGRELVEPRDAFARDARLGEPSWIPVWPWLVVLALLLLPLDIALRRLVIFRR